MLFAGTVTRIGIAVALAGSGIRSDCRITPEKLWTIAKDEPFQVRKCLG